MNICIISFTKAGGQLATVLETHLAKDGHQVNNVAPKSGTLKDYVKDCFEKNRENAIVFIGAAGIAVRSIAPFLTSKWQDPAVVVIDEKGEYVIPILSGHIGGANKLAKQIAKAINGQAVITTASDVNEKIALDVWAKEQNLAIMDTTAMKRMAVLNLEEKPIGIIIEDSKYVKESIDLGVFEDISNIDKFVKTCEEIGDIDSVEGLIYIGYHPDKFKKTKKEFLWLLPRTLALGIGCKKDTPEMQIEKAIQKAFEMLGYSEDCLAAITGIYSIDLKKDEVGIKAVADKYQVPFYCFSKEELNQVDGDFHKSEFVESITGVDCVCERAAICGNPDSFLLLNKYANDGVTIAISAR